MSRTCRRVVVPALLLLLGAFGGAASAQTITFTNRPSPGTVGLQYSFQYQTSPSGTYTFACDCIPAPGLSLSSSGAITGTPTSAGAFTFTVTATDPNNPSNSTGPVPMSLRISSPPLTILTTSLPNGVAGASYSFALSASGGSGTYSWGLYQGASLPPALSLASSGLISGTTTTAGTYTFRVQASDSSSSVASQPLSITVNNPPLTLAPATVANGIVGVKYVQSFTAGGGTGTYSITLTSAAPAGLSFSASGASATLSGTPTNYGSFPVGIQVTDGTSPPLTRGYTLAISPAPLVITTNSLAGGAQNAQYNQSLAATGGAPPYAWTLSSGSLPPGLSLSSAGIISGSSAGMGTYTFGVKVTDSYGATASATVSIVLQPAPLVILTTSPLPPAVSGATYSAGLAASGGVPPYTFSLISGPAGLSLSGSTLTGKLTNLGIAPVTYNLTVQVRDSASNTAGAGLSLTVQPAAAGIILSAGSLSFTAISGGAPPNPQYVSVSSTTEATPAFTVSSNPSWLLAGPSGGNAPATLQVGVNQSSLSVGSYSGSVTVTGPDGVHTVSVALAVAPASPQLSVAPSVVSFSTDGISQPSPGGIQISNTGNGALNYSASVSNGSSWISLGSAPSLVTAQSPVSLPVSVNIAGLRSGDYRDVVHISSDAGNADVAITLLIAGASTINLVPAGVLFSSRESQGIANGARTFSILTTGTNPVTFGASLPDAAPWLTLNTLGGVSAPNSAGAVSYTVDPSKLASGNYYARIRITAPGATDSPLDFLVVASVALEASPALPDPAPAGLLFISQPGSPVPPAQNIVVNTSSQTAVNFSTAANTSSGNWLSVSPANGIASSATPGQVTATVNPAGLAPGVYSGGVSFTLVGNPVAVRTVNVVLLVTGSSQSSSSISGANPQLTFRGLTSTGACAPSKLVALQTGLVSNFSTPAGWPAPLAIQLVDDCGSAVTSGQVVATFSNGDAPLALQLSDNKNAVYSATWTPHGSSAQVTVTARATAANLAAATAQIIGAVSPNQVPILYKHGTIHNLNPQAGASLAPGTIVQIYGSGLAPSTLQTALPLPADVNGTIVIVGGIEAPLYFVSNGQLNAQLPLELTPGRQCQILVSANGALTVPDTLDIEAATPGVAALASGAVIAQHADSSYVTASSTARPGEILTIYLAGMGLTDVAMKDGQQSPSTPLAHPDIAPTVTVNGENAAISFAGLTPQAVGLYQINFQVPADAPNGSLQLVVSQAGALSNTTMLPVQQ